jgi:hypothetical protein
MILMTPGRSQTKRRPLPSFGLAMWIGSTKLAGDLDQLDLHVAGQLAAGTGRTRASSGLTVDSMWGLSLALARTRASRRGRRERTATAAARHSVEIRFHTRS